MQVLEAAEGLTGIARGIAFQIAEALGVLDRTKVADDVKVLEQTDRAALRAMGVRFGAYHLTLPALLKPAPRSLAAQLWALKETSGDVYGLDDILHLAHSGRTSIPVDEQVMKELYRAAGFRVCGTRAVRVAKILLGLAASAKRKESTSTGKPAGFSTWVKTSK